MNKEIRIRDEEILLMGLCRLEFNPETKIMVMALAEGVIDWKYFASLANSHGVAALVFHNLEKLQFLSLLPEETVQFLRASYMKSLSRNTFNNEAMGEVLSLLNRENIKTVLLKGLALELTVYENSGLRQMSDVDILIGRDQCMLARGILMQNGYESLPVKSVFHKLILADIGKHLPSLINKGTSVEIHHELFGANANALTKMLYDNSRLIEIKGEKAYIPQPQIFFLYLVKHLYLHEMNNESQLRLYTDLIVLLGKHFDEIINYDLLAHASEAGMSKILAWRLEPLRDLWGVSFPEWMNDFINNWYDPDSINKFIFFVKSPKGNPPINKQGFYRQMIKEIPGIHRKILYVLGDIFPSISFMKKRYKCSSKWRVVFYYPHRIGKVFWLIGKTKDKR